MACQNSPILNRKGYSQKAELQNKRQTSYSKNGGPKYTTIGTNTDNEYLCNQCLKYRATENNEFLQENIFKKRYEEDYLKYINERKNSERKEENNSQSDCSTRQNGLNFGNFQLNSNGTAAHLPIYIPICIGLSVVNDTHKPMYNQEMVDTNSHIKEFQFQMKEKYEFDNKDERKLSNEQKENHNVFNNDEQPIIQMVETTACRTQNKTNVKNGNLNKNNSDCDQVQYKNMCGDSCVDSSEVFSDESIINIKTRKEDQSKVVENIEDIVFMKNNNLLTEQRTSHIPITKTKKTNVQDIMNNLLAPSKIEPEIGIISEQDLVHYHHNVGNSSLHLSAESEPHLIEEDETETEMKEHDLKKLPLRNFPKDPHLLLSLLSQSHREIFLSRLKGTKKNDTILNQMSKNSSISDMECESYFN